MAQESRPRRRDLSSPRPANGDADSPGAGPANIESLRQELNARRNEIERQREELERTRQELEEARRKLEERQGLEEALRAAEQESRQHAIEVSALLEGAHAILGLADFQASARSIFDICKHMIGATAGYIALVSDSSFRVELLFLDTGGQTCTVDPSRSMPMRGLREVVYRTGETIYENDFVHSRWAELLPEGHTDLANVLFAPLTIKGVVVGLLGLGNKPGGFAQSDVRIATAFGQLVAVALLNSRATESLRENEARFRAVTQSAADAIIIIDSSGKIVFWNAAAEAIFGYAADEAVGQSISLIMPERFHAAHYEGMERLIATGVPRLLGKTVEMVGSHKAGHEFPVELALSTWTTQQEAFFTGIVRDITERRRANDEIRSLAKFPSENRNPVLRVSHVGTILYANPASAPLLAAWDTQIGQPAPGEVRNLVADALGSAENRRTQVPCDGRIFSFDLAPVQEGKYVNLYGRDVTEQVQAEEQLREKNRFITHVFESLSHPFYVVDAHDYSVKMANRAAYRTDLPVDITCHALTHRQDSPCDTYGEICPLEQIRRTKEPVMVEHTHYDQHGNRRCYEVRGYPLLDDEGNVVQIIEYTLDITERTRAQEALQRAHDELEMRVQERTAELARANEELQRVAFENAELYEAETHARQMAETLSAATRALTQTLDLDTTINTLLDLLDPIVPYDGATIMLPHDETRFVVRAARGCDGKVDAEDALGSLVDAEQNPHLDQIVRTGQSLLIADTRQHPGWTECTGTGAVLSWLGLPLVVGERVIGICGLHKAEPEFYDERYVRLAEALAAQAAVAVQNAWLFQQVRTGRERLRALSRRLVEVQETERRYIARELHDEAGQALTSLMVGLRLLERQAHDREAVIAGVEELMGMVDCVIDNLHRLSMHLRPAALDHLGLVAALRQYAEAISDQHGLTLEFEAVGLAQRLPPDMEASLHRIVQEALTNVVRHAEATRVDVLLEQQGDKLVVLVEDNGVGFDPATVYEKGRLGVFGMRERTEMLGGTLTVESAPGAGTTLLLEIPYGNTDPDRG
jgi:PAS domain S-box-containing protein